MDRLVLEIVEFNIKQYVAQRRIGRSKYPVS